MRSLEEKREYMRQYLRQHRYGSPVDGYPEQSCKGCSKTFRPVTKKQVFCCKNCGTNWRASNVYRYKRNFYRTQTVRHYLQSLLKKKNRSAGLGIDYLVSLYEAQGGLCAITGREMTFVAGAGRVMTNISIDQIQAKAGYTEGNIQLVCYAVNVMKNSMEMDELRDWCRAILGEH